MRDASADKSSEAKATKLKAPFDLAALGVDHPHRRWREAVDELHRQTDAADRDAARAWRRVEMLIRTQIAWERRGSPGWGPSSADLDESALEMAAIKARAVLNA